jgi:hypothetical protein
LKRRIGGPVGWAVAGPGRSRRVCSAPWLDSPQAGTAALWSPRVLHWVVSDAGGHSWHQNIRWRWSFMPTCAGGHCSAGWDDGRGPAFCPCALRRHVACSVLLGQLQYSAACLNGPRRPPHLPCSSPTVAPTRGESGSSRQYGMWFPQQVVISWLGHSSWKVFRMHRSLMAGGAADSFATYGPFGAV